MEVTGNQNVDLNSQFVTIVATHPHLQLNRNSIPFPPPSLNFVVHPGPSFARFCESRISSLRINRLLRVSTYNVIITQEGAQKGNVWDVDFWLPSEMQTYI